MNIFHFRFIIFNLKFFCKIVNLYSSSGVLEVATDSLKSTDHPVGKLTLSSQAFAAFCHNYST